MKYRLPKLEDKNQVYEYIREHYENNEKSLSASNGLTSMNYKDWVEKINRNVTVPDEVWGKSLTYFVFDNNKIGEVRKE